MTGLETIVADIWGEIIQGDRDYEAAYWTTGPEFPLAHALMLAGLAAGSNGPIVEIGTDSGMGTLALAYGARVAALGHRAGPEPVYSFDVNPTRQAKAKARVERYRFQNVHFILDEGRRANERVREEIGLAFIDGNHSYRNCKADLEAVAAMLNKWGKILVHDFGNPVDYAGRIKDNGVAHALAEFLSERPDWQGLEPSHGWFMLTNKGAHPLRGWDVRAALAEIRRHDGGQNP